MAIPMTFRADTFCGLYCGACDVLQANMHGTVKALARAWEMEAQQLVCHGCKSDVNAVYCADCDLKACATGKGLEYCFECAEYPCPRLVAFRHDDAPHHSAVLHNLDRLRGQGLERWSAEQEARWSCPQCGAAFTWYNQVCKTCGGKLYNCQDEESRITAEEGK